MKQGYKGKYFIFYIFGLTHMQQGPVIAGILAVTTSPIVEPSLGFRSVSSAKMKIFSAGITKLLYCNRDNRVSEH